MTFTFYSNFLNHHQLPFCEAMVSLIGDGFTFVACESFNQTVVSKGYEDMNKAYGFVLRAYESESAAKKALELALESDVIMHGSAPEFYVKKRLAQTKQRITFRYNERIFKASAGRIRYLSMGYIYTALYHIHYCFNPIYLLAASAYTPYDFVRVGFRKDRIFKWGYFPATSKNDLKALIAKKGSVTRLVWAGRMIGWKHPETAITLAKALKARGADFKLVMVGDGELREGLERDVRESGLETYVEFTGGIPARRVRDIMEESDIHILTSDFNEGWGAVLNESMASACAPVCAHSVGAAPYLITHGADGFIYRLGDNDELANHVLLLLRDREALRRMQRAAYDKITTEWNADSAARALIALSEELLSGGKDYAKSGPCSPAEYILQRDMYQECVKNAII